MRHIYLAILLLLSGCANDNLSATNEIATEVFGDEYEFKLTLYNSDWFDTADFIKPEETCYCKCPCSEYFNPR